MHRRTLLLGSFLAAGAAAPDALQPLLDELAGPGRPSVGAVGAIVEAGQAHLAVAGGSGAADGRALDADTVFEVGSITKLFTALLLADMVQRRELDWGDRLVDLLPPEGRPRGQGRNIRLIDLATNMSGLPRLPGNLRPADGANPYAEYGVAQLYRALNRAPPHSPTERYEYSNFGFGVLGHALSLRAGRPYEDLVVDRICTPLGLDSTRITLPPALRARLAPGHDANQVAVPGWDFQALAGAGALRSTPRDMLRFLRACQGTCEGQPDTPLAAALTTLLFPRRYIDAANQGAAGWSVRRDALDEVAWKDGGTGGYTAFIGYSTRTGRAAVLLANSAAPAVPWLGLHLVNAGYPRPALRR